MKKSMLLTGALMLMMASCSNEEILPNEEVKNNAEPTLTIIATQGEDADSRIAYNPSADGKTISLTWSEGDAIYVCEAEHPSNFIELTLEDGAGTAKGTFTTTEEIPWSEGEELVAYYKANDEMLYIDEEAINFYPLDYNYVPQVQTTNGNTEHLKKVNYMKSEAFTYTESAVSNLQFSQMGAIMQLNLSGLSGKTIKELKLTLDDGSKSLVCYESHSIYEDVYEVEKFFMHYASITFGENGAGIVADETFTVYLMLGATELTDGKQLTLYATASDGNVYSASVTGGKVEAGKKYTLSKAMEPFNFFNEGKGTETSPYMISTAQHLKDLSNYINAGCYMEGVHFKLKNNIDLSSEYGEGKGNWIPRIGTDGNDFGADDTPLGFKGTFDGGGNTISGLYFNNSEEGNIALFGCISDGGTLKNLHVEGNITANWYSAGLVANNWGTVSGCTFTGSVTTDSYGAGGIVSSNGGTVIGCSNSGTITSLQNDASPGGIVGYMNDGNIKACYNTGTIEGTIKGGIVGEISYADGNVTIDACYHTSETPVVGYIYESTVAISNCYWASNSVENAVGTGSATTVTGGGRTADWSAAMSAMNSALNGSGWQYEENTDDATKEKEPLLLKKGNNDYVPV